MLSYSVAIRTLGKSPETLKIELESLHAQTIKPQDIIIYLAKGYQRPDFTVGIERYIYVDKGMVAQRALPYTEITGDTILLLDDDIAFDKDTIEKTLYLMENYSADCIAFDTFKNHKMSIQSKLKAIVWGGVFPHLNKNWAFRIYWNDSFSYINSPGHGCYPSMSAAGPAALWKKTSLLALHLEDEIWLDKLGFAYGDDGLEFFKLHVNGGKLMVTFDDGIKNLDAKSASSSYHQSAEKFLIISKASIIKWHRMQIAGCTSKLKKWLKVLSFSIKIGRQLALVSVLSVLTGNKMGAYYRRGISEATKYLKSETYQSLPPYRNYYIKRPTE